MFYLFDYDAWFEAMQEEADLHGVKHMVPNDMKDDPDIQQAFRDQIAPDDYVYEFILQEMRSDDLDEDV